MTDTIAFNPSTVLRLIAASLPPDSVPQLKNPHDAIAVFVHACMLSVGFRLVGLQEDDRLVCTDAPIEATNPRPLPRNWNATPGSYGFRYAHEQSSMQYLIKCNRLGSKTVIMGLGLGDDKTTSFEVVTNDFLSESFFPYTAQELAGENQSGDAAPPRYTSPPLENGFISASRITDLAILVKINIVQKLMPGLVKPGYEEERSGEGGQQQQPRNRGDFNDPLPPRVPHPYGGPQNDPLRYPRPGPPLPVGGERPPGFDDEYEILQGPRGVYPPLGGRNPLSIGADDLNPPGLGPNPPLRGPFFGEGGGGYGGMGPMGGMHPTGDHPMFGGRGGDEYPDPRFPPGARYDPVGPGDAPRGGLGGPRGPGRGGGFGGPRGSGGFGGGFGGFGGNDFI
ncbi:hypothetical protein RUND412_001750 [Rhizina undulata]